MKIIACVPVYNEEKVVEKLVNEIFAYVDEVIVCDDGSSDNTLEQLSKTKANVLKHKKNMGKGAALKTLFNYAEQSDGDIFVTIDGDGQFLPKEIPKLVEPIKNEQLDIVIGYRFESNEQMPYYRQIGNKMLDKMTNIASELPFRDTQSGFRAYSKSAINSIKFETNGFGVDSEILIDASKKKLRIGETKVTVLYETGSQTSTKNPVSHTGEVISSILELIALKRPLAFLGIPGIILIIIGIGFSIFVLSTFNETRYFSIPFTLILLGSFIIGIMLVLMSIVLFGFGKTTKNNI